MRIFDVLVHIHGLGTSEHRNMALHTLGLRRACVGTCPSTPRTNTRVAHGRPRTVCAAAENPKPRRGRKRAEKAPSGEDGRIAGGTQRAGGQGGDVPDLKKLHDELMQQIAERKRAQAELLDMMGGDVRGDADRADRADRAGDGPEPTAKVRRLPTANARPSPPVASPAESKQVETSQVEQVEQIEPIEQAAPSQVEQVAPPGQQEAHRATDKDLLNIVVVAAECAPWSKTGGLGDVVGALPKFLAQRGHRVMVVAPRYKGYEDVWETGVRHRVRVMGQDHEYGYFHACVDGVDFVFVDHSCYMSFGDDIYGGSRQDLQFRCALLSKAALEAPKVVPCGGTVYGDESLVFIANDWHTALLPVYLNAHYRDYGQMVFARSVFVIHNIAHQGRAPMDELNNLEIPDNYTELFRLYDPIGGEHMNVLKAGLNQSHRVVAVSNGYAWECQTPEGGWGLDGVVRDVNWKLRGVVNGIDINDWNPAVDVHLESDGYQRYSVDNYREGKAACKAALQRELGLPVNPDVPMLGFIGRLDYQKGVDLIVDNYEWLMSEGVQLVLLGSGRDDLEGMLRDMENRNNDKCRAWVGFSVATAHRITAAADILLMPSRFEPCGLNQLYAMEYGTVPVVHAVGGLRDTVQPFNPYENSGTGWTFECADSGAFQRALGDALYTFRSHRDSFEGLQERGMVRFVQ